jgi:hypothetical protein
MGTAGPAARTTRKLAIAIMTLIMIMKRTQHRYLSNPVAFRFSDAILFIPDTLILCCIHQCLLFIAFMVRACEYIIMTLPHIFSSFLLLAHFTLLGTG